MPTFKNSEFVGVFGPFFNFMNRCSTVQLGGPKLDNLYIGEMRNISSNIAKGIKIDKMSFMGAVGQD